MDASPLGLPITNCRDQRKVSVLLVFYHSLARRAGFSSPRAEVHEGFAVAGPTDSDIVAVGGLFGVALGGFFVCVFAIGVDDVDL